MPPNWLLSPAQPACRPLLRAAMLIAISLLLVDAILADPRLVERPPLGHFEPNYHDYFQAADAQQRRRKAQTTSDGCSSAVDPPGSPIDLRVSKAHASHGYDAVRISVVGTSPDPPAFVRRPLDTPAGGTVEGDGIAEDEVLTWAYSAPLQYRWTAQFDTGVANARCVASLGSNSLIQSYNYTWGGYSESPAPDSQCLFDCQGNDECQYFSQYYNQTTNECICKLFRECDQCIDTTTDMTELVEGYINDDENDAVILDQAFEDHLVEKGDTNMLKGWTTTKKYGKSFIHTAIVKVVPGISNPFVVDGTEFDVRIPEDGESAKCVIWGDPCISSKFVGCSFGKYFDAYAKSVEMINALAEADVDEGGFDCFIMLGDNFYDSDGTITTSFWKRLSTKAMSKPLVYILGNHDIWTGGAPSDGVVYDPLQYSLQYLGIDSVVSADNGTYFDYSINPDDPPAGSGTKYQSITATSSIKNSVGWYKLGGFGLLFFNGGYSGDELLPYFNEACEFFEENVGKDETVLLIGHWNGNETIQSWVLPYGGQVVTPRARELLLDLPGCSHFGARIIYFDGHGHTNQVVPGDNGYLAGGHGIMGASPNNFSVPVAADYGFMYTKSSRTSVHYCQEIFVPTSSLPETTAAFDPSTINYDKYNALVECLKDAGIEECVKLCERWTYFGDAADHSGDGDGDSNEDSQDGGSEEVDDDPETTTSLASILTMQTNVAPLSALVVAILFVAHL